MIKKTCNSVENNKKKYPGKIRMHLGENTVRRRSWKKLGTFDSSNEREPARAQTVSARE